MTKRFKPFSSNLRQELNIVKEQLHYVQETFCQLHWGECEYECPFSGSKGGCIIDAFMGAIDQPPSIPYEEAETWRLNCKYDWLNRHGLLRYEKGELY